MERSRCSAGAQAKTVQDINKHLRLISLTPILSKIAEKYVVNTYVKNAVLLKIDPQQFGTVPKSSTMHALISMIHSWAKSTDGMDQLQESLSFSKISVLEKSESRRVNKSSV